MVTFVSMFLSLVAGITTVEVAVGEPVAAVEIRLDGTKVGLINGPPWAISCDFGVLLRPHRLSAIALDSAGQKLGEAVQLVNVPRPRAEVSLLLEQSSTGTPSAARLICSNPWSARPDRVSVLLDGVPLIIEDPNNFSLGEYDAGELHVLSAEVEFAGDVLARADTIFGSAYGSEVRSELTALALTIGPDRDAPTPDALQGLFLRDGRPLRVAAVEQTGRSVFVVRDHASEEKMRKLAQMIRGMVQGRTFGRFRHRSKRDRFQPTEVARFVAPCGERHFADRPDTEALFFPVSKLVDFGRNGLAWVVASFVIYAPADGVQRLADAVAVAGVRACATSTPRAVILITGENPEDHSGQTAATTAQYLSSLGVPLYVWSTAGAQASSPWGPTVDVSTVKGLKRAARALEADLDRQWIVWIEGTHLPPEITVVESS